MARILFSMLIAVCAMQAAAHEVRPAYLQIREVEPATYDVLWKTPAQGDLRLALNVILPQACIDQGEARVTLVRTAVVEHRRSHCPDGLLGKRIVIENLETSLTDVIVRFEPHAGTPKTLRIDGANPTFVIPERQPTPIIAATYFRLGVEHIAFGFDHLLFVLCLVMLIASVKRLIITITAFTVAHSITLAATTFGWVRLAIEPVEACIALSIALIAAAIIRARDKHAGMTQRWPWIAALAFGLLHGFGFASALREIGLPEDAVPFALLFFNLGVEAGQLLFVCIVLALLLALRTYAPRVQVSAWRASAYLAGTLASYWFIERSVRVFS